MSMFLLVSCQTTQSAETTQIKSESETQKVVEEKKKEEVIVENPLANMETLPPGLVVKSVKPVICGEIGEMMNNFHKRFGEKPVLAGEEHVRLHDGTVRKGMVTMLYNEETQSFTFLEQMPADERLICVLSAGKIIRVNIKNSAVGSSL